MLAPLRRPVTARITWYCPCAVCCGINSPARGGAGRTRSGPLPLEGYTVAADWRVWPKGAILLIEGVGMREVRDTGSGVKGHHLDVFVRDHRRALANGTRRARVWRVQ